MKLLKAITHPNIVKYIDSFVNGTKFYIIMEYCEKGDLDTYLNRFKLTLDIPESKIWKFII